MRVMEQQIHPRMNGIHKSRASDDLNASGNEPPTGIFPYKVGGPSTCTNPMCMHTIPKILGISDGLGPLRQIFCRKNSGLAA